MANGGSGRPIVVIITILLVAFAFIGFFLESSSESSLFHSGPPGPPLPYSPPEFDILHNEITSLRADIAELSSKVGAPPTAPAAKDVMPPVLPGGTRIGESSGPNDADHTIREDAFTEVYRKNSWGSGESRSGTGSEASATIHIRRFLETTFKIFELKRFLDSPCGDCNWQWNITGLETMSYTGIDVVPDVIIADAKKHFDKPWMKFVNIDLAAENLPKNLFEVILCRDMLQHLPMAAGIKAIENFEQTGAKYLVTNFHSLNYNPATGGNHDVNPGGYYMIDPMKAPFNFPRPLYYAMEHPHVTDGINGVANYKMVGVWKLPVLGKGDGTSLLPLSDETLNETKDSKFVVVDSEMGPKLKAAGVPFI